VRLRPGPARQPEILTNSTVELGTLRSTWLDVFTSWFSPRELTVGGS
jgi:hypothetical protein